MTQPTQQYLDNRLLRALAPPDMERLQPHLIPIDLPAGQPITQAGVPIDDAYFIGSGFVSMVQPLADGASIEVGLIGPEGFVGVHAILGARSSPSAAMVQLAGHGWRMPLDVLRAEMETNHAFRRDALLFAQALSVQITYSVACNARHTIKQRLARWLSAARDRTESDGLTISQEFLAMMLGSRRADVAYAIASLTELGCFTNSQHQITVTDRGALQTAACECYSATRDEYETLFA